MVLGHDGHTLIDGVLPSHEDDRACHDLPDEGSLRRTALEDHFAGVITFRQDAVQSAV